MSLYGQEWIIEARGADAVRLADQAVLERLFARIVGEMQLRPVAPAVWHRFPAPGGLTGIQILAESHLTVHTFPEHGTICLNVFCCTPRDEFDFASALSEAIGARVTQIRCLERSYGPEGQHRARSTPVSVRVIRAE